MRRWSLWLILLNLCLLLTLAFAMPQPMLAPGPLIPAHAAIGRDCFACHAPLRGAVAERCIACHKIADIGRRTTKHAPLAPGFGHIAFHQALTQPDCIACHSDHAGPALVKLHKPHFAHALLRPEIGGQCAACHRAPATALHTKASGDCAQCHSQTGWKPASFDHAKLFALTGPHATACATCHKGADYSRYTCFGCHQHQPDQMRAKHASKGITNIENCVSCHRGAGEGGEGGEGGEQRGNRRDDD